MKLIVGKNDLATTHPDLAKEADGWDPTTVVVGTHKKLQWKCSKGHNWIAPGYRRSNGSGCPVCDNKQVLVGYNDLATTHPDLAKEADGWDPKKYVYGSDKRVKWICQKGHEWIVRIADRSAGKGCPICSNKRILLGYNDLATTHPELAKQAVGWDPRKIIAGTLKKLEWKCEDEHIWTARVSHRTKSESGCPICSNHKILVGYNDLGTTHPELAKEADGWNPKTVTAGTSKKLQWKCSKGHNWIAPGSRRSNGSGCPVCSNQILLVGQNDLATTYPDLAKEAHGWDPKTVSAGTNKKLQWKCSQNHIWTALGSKRMKGNGCPVCSNQEVLIGYNDLATTHPELAKEAHGWDPATVIAGTDKKLQWMCSKTHTWSAVVNSRTKGIGCPVCSNQKVLTGYNDLATTHPELAKQADGWDPKNVISGRRQKLQWKCPENHAWTTSGVNKTKKLACPFCSNDKVLEGFNDLATTHPELAKQANGWNPKTIIAGTHKKLQWKCTQGHKWKATGYHRSRGRGCPSCSTSGFDPNKDGYLYYLIQPNWEVYQIGITNIPDDRLARHKKNGFELLELRGPMDGHTAQELETALLRYLKSQKADLSPEQFAGKFDGFSESWTIDSYKVNNLKELIDKASEAGF